MGGVDEAGEDSGATRADAIDEIGEGVDEGS